MSRRFFLDRSPGEIRAVVTLDGEPERLIIEREDEPRPVRPGARFMGRVRRVERGLASAFLDLGEGRDAILPLGDGPALAEGAVLEVEIAAEARRGKVAVSRLVGPGGGAPRLVAPAPDAESRLLAFAGGAEVVEGALAREAADEAQAQILAVEHGLPGGGAVHVEPTRALIAVDVDLGAASIGRDPRRGRRQVNLAAVAATARLLRLKSLGGIVAIDLAGQGHDGAALAAAAKSAFAPDQPGVALGPISRFGVMELVVPRRERPVGELLLDDDGRLSALSVALDLARNLEREGRADPGARLRALCAPEVADALAPLLGRLGPRFSLSGQLGWPRTRTDIQAS